MRHNRQTVFRRTFIMAAMTRISLTLSGQALASSPPGWQPQISDNYCKLFSIIKSSVLKMT